MISVYDLSWQNFKAVEVLGASVGDLVQLAHNGEQAFVFYDRQARLPALVQPGQVFQIVDEFGLRQAESILETGLLDLLRRGQMMVHTSQPAARAAGMAERYGIPVVIAVGLDNYPQGLFVPSVVVERIPQGYLFQQQTSPELRDEFIRLSRAGRFGAAINALGKEHEEFHAEPVNIVAADPYYCQGGGGHWASSCPCGDPNHDTKQCGRSQLASTPPSL
jgi:hypothetical protein